MGETWNKREREQKKRNAKKQKEERKQERKEHAGKAKGLDDMLAYVDEYGNLSATPPPERKAVKIDNIPPVVANSRELNAIDDTRKGVVTFYDSNKGYGFIKDSTTGESIFVHVNSTSVQLKEQLKVAFEVQKGPKGMVAVNVTAA
ncbi:cold shock domain-containing protein [Niabella pedocola]|uniref:Cold shock domain-containing protein n=1 Tax=Niabella pedocola TaxID=1752077 RepID=A0ABS8PSM3_9BACT|nr:cold shock domain-containing protein [Niabella pedocola]MBO9591517.1 cold shock domain-containing protein [Niabella sp.]MCD2424070.1 cold shock domain-containing protein [Niabella pedocola]